MDKKVFRTRRQGTKKAKSGRVEKGSPFRIDKGIKHIAGNLYEIAPRRAVSLIKNVVRARLFFQRFSRVDSLAFCMVDNSLAARAT